LTIRGYPEDNSYIITHGYECGKADEQEEEQEQPAAAGARSLGSWGPNVKICNPSARQDPIRD